MPKEANIAKGIGGSKLLPATHRTHNSHPGSTPQWNAYLDWKIKSYTGCLSPMMSMTAKRGELDSRHAGHDWNHVDP